MAVLALACLLVLVSIETAATAASRFVFTARKDVVAVKASDRDQNQPLLSLAIQFCSTIREARKHLIAGAAARGVSTFLLYPLDTFKTRTQLSASARRVLEPLTLTSLYKGVAGTLAGQIPYGMLVFGSYEVYKAKLVERYPAIKVGWLYLMAAVAGDLTGSIWICPFEVVKQNVQGGVHSTIVGAIRSILKESGPAGFYKGYLSQVLRDVPFRAVSLTTYEIMKSFYTSSLRRRIATTKDREKESGDTELRYILLHTPYTHPLHTL